MKKIPKCMSTQHPDNVNTPFFCENGELKGEDEVKEAYYVYSHLGCDEQMWDCEGKEIDNYVIKKLLTSYPYLFKKKTLGEELFLTLRVPNPQLEKAEGKILLETLESIPRSFDIAKIFYKEDKPPIYEVILPMTSSVEEINSIYYYYRDFVIGKENSTFVFDGKKNIKDWVGEFKPKTVNVIPLFEDKDSMLECDNILKEYLKDKKITSQRVFLARSDPAMNYGFIGAVLLNKIALWKIDRLAKKIGVDLFPIIGVGSAPFRGGLTPYSVKRVTEEFPSVHTFTIQSAFKYDYPLKDVKDGIDFINASKTGKAIEIDEQKSMGIIERCAEGYGRDVIDLATTINSFSKFIPRRRKRKLHIGLFGYSRKKGELKLPRAITFCASLYSLGVPPEVLGISVLSLEDLNFINQFYPSFKEDLRDAVKFLNPQSPYLPKGVLEKLSIILENYDVDEEHKLITDQIISDFSKDNTEGLQELILQAAKIRCFLG